MRVQSRCAAPTRVLYYTAAERVCTRETERELSVSCGVHRPGGGTAPDGPRAARGARSDAQHVRGDAVVQVRRPHEVADAEQELESAHGRVAVEVDCAAERAGCTSRALFLMVPLNELLDESYSSHLCVLPPGARAPKWCL